MYQLNKNEITGKIEVVIRLEDNLYIPMVEANTDYQAYLKWVAEGNEPLPAETN